MSHFQKSNPFNIATLGIRSGFAITISTEGILEPGIVIIDAPGLLVLTPFDVEVLDGGEAIAVDTASLVLTAPTVLIGDFVAVDTAALVLTSFDVKLNVDIAVDTVALALTSFDVELDTVIDVDTGVLALTSFDIELDVDINVDVGQLVLTSFDIELDVDINVDVGQLVLTPLDHKLFPGEVIDIDTSRLSLSGFPVAVNTAINTDTDIRRGILANEIHIYLINPTLTSTVDSFGFRLIGVDPQHRQDFSLQGWASTDQWGRGQDSRSLLTRRNNAEVIRFLSTAFIAANNIDDRAMLELERIYPGTIHVFDKSDPDIYMHVKNVTGHKLFYQLVNDTENFNVYLRHLNLIPADLDVIV